MLNTGLSPWPSFTGDEAEAVRRVLLSNRVNYWSGEETREFEKEFAAWSGASHAVALSNGTVALELALRALDIGPGDEVVVTPRSFAASATCVLNVGATPVFADVDADSQNVTPETVARVLTSRSKAIIPVHLAGWPCEMDGFGDLARARGLVIVEDCAQAHGARYRGGPIGAIGDIGAWSFCQDKIMTTGGEGGMVTTQNRELWSRMWSYKDHGKNWEAVHERQHPPGFRWVHDSVGTNARMIEMEAVIGRIQLRRMPEWRLARAANARWMAEAAQRCPALRVPQVPAHVEHAWYKFYCFVRPEALKAGWGRDRIMAEVNALGVPCYSGSCPEIYLERAFADRRLGPAQRLPVARELGETSLMFLVHPTLTGAEIGRVGSALERVMRQATR